jgi:hypothetical protein
VTDELTVEELERLRPDSVEQLLVDLGWRLEEDRSSAAIWATAEASVLVPRDRSYSDYLQRLHEAIAIVREVDPDGWRVSLPSLFAVRSDILRFRSDVDTPFDGSMPLMPGVTLIDSIPEVLRAAAKASTSTKLRHYANRNHDIAREYLETARLGQTARGSFVVTVISRLPEPPPATEDDVDPELLPAAPPEPMQRAVNVQLATALGAARDAAATFARTSDFGAFEQAVPQGVSAELCAAAIGMLEAGGDVEFAFTPTPDVPTSVAINSRVILSREHLGPLHTAHDEFKRTAPISEVSIRGRVDNLNRPGMKEGRGTVAVKVIGGDTDVNMVRVPLDASEYAKAIDAHRDGRELNVTGRLEREGNLFWLYDPHTVSVGAVILTRQQKRQQAAEAQGSILEDN